MQQMGPKEQWRFGELDCWPYSKPEVMCPNPIVKAIGDVRKSIKS